MKSFIKRSRIDIIAEILEASSKEGTIKSTIMHHANLDSDQFKIYSEFLQERHLLEKIDGDNTTYKTTQKGYEFLGHVNYIRRLLTKEK